MGKLIRFRVIFVLGLVTTLAFLSYGYFNLGTIEGITLPAHANTTNTNVLITEVEYDPTQSGGDAPWEWIELYNPTGAAIDMGGWTLSDNHDTFTFPANGVTIAPGEYFLIVNDTVSFNTEHPGIVPDLEMDPGGNGALKLSNSGDQLILADDGANSVDYVAWENYVAGWSATGNAGESICRGDVTDTDTTNDWVSHCVPDPSTGSYDAPPEAVNDAVNTYANAVGVSPKFSVSVNVLLNDSDPDAGQSISISTIDGVARVIGTSFAVPHGTAVQTSATTISFTPDDGWQGTTQFPYTIVDDHADALTDTAYIQITTVPHQITGTVWHDENADGVKDVAEITPILDVNVRLYSDDNGNGTWDDGVDTLLEVNSPAVGTGNYILSSAVFPGDYFVIIIPDDPALAGDPNNAGLTYGATTSYVLPISITSSTGVITNQNIGYDDALVTLSLDNPQIVENGGTVTITATVSPITGFDTTVHLAFDGSAGGADYSYTSATLVIPAMDHTKTTTVTALDDVVLDPNETIEVSIDTLLNASEDGNQDKSVLILDDEKDTDGDGIINAVDDDDDGDGVADTEEATAPNGDGNGDGLQDSLQHDVASVVNPNTHMTTTMVVTDAACNIINAYDVVNEVDLASQDTGFDYPMGLNDFNLECNGVGASATLVFYYDKVYDTADWVYRKYDSSTGEYRDITSVVSFGTATVDGRDVTTVTMQLRDGDMQTDDDGVVNSVIVDPSGPAVHDDSIEGGELARTGGDLRPWVGGMLLTLAMSTGMLARRQIVSRVNS